MNIECIRLDKNVITHLPNTCINKVKKQQPWLQKLKFTEEASKEQYLPVHILLGVQDYQRIRTSKPPVLGTKSQSDPVAEYTKLGWILMEVNTNKQAKDIC